MAETWPASLPQQPLVGAAVPVRDNKITSQTDVGPDKVRRRSTVAGGETSYTFALTFEQALTFKGFYEDDLKDGVLPFTGLEDQLNNQVTFRIKGAPKFTRRANHYDLTLDLEVVP